MRREIQGIPTEHIEEQLKRLQSSSLFSHSKRYPGFLEFVVKKTLEGREDELKERTIGVEAFGRPSTYDLNADPVVRVTAGEVRKRLAQYYYESEHQSELRIELRLGSYVPDFRLPSPALVQEPEVDLTQAIASSLPELSSHTAPVQSTEFGAATPSRWKYAAIALGIAFLIALAGNLIPLMHRPSYVDKFWAPVVDNGSPVLLSVGSVVAMVNGNSIAPPPDTVSGHPLSSDPIAVSDAVALSSIQQVLSSRSRASTLQSSTSTTFSDLQHGPVILISGFNNPWTMRLTDSLRIHFVRLALDDYSIQDRSDPTHKVWSLKTSVPLDKIGHDYGLVARFHDPVTEQIVVVIAGIGEYGTVAGSRLLTEDRYLAELEQAGIFPRSNQNFECVVETQLIDGKPGPPRIVGSYIW